MRHVLRLSSLILAVFVSLLSVVLVQHEDASYPLQTNRSVLIRLDRSLVPKEQLVASLNAAAEAGNCRLVKSVANSSDPALVRDVVWFGATPPSSATTLTWFDPKLSGSLLPSTQLGSRPLAGHYNLVNSRGCEDSLTAWATQSHAELAWDKERSALADVAEIFVKSGNGLAVMAAMCMWFATALVFLGSRAKSRAIRLVGGVPALRIHAADLWILIRTGLTWVLVGWLAAVGWVGVERGIGAVGIFAMWSLPILAGVFAVIVTLCCLTSLVTRPRAATIANRLTFMKPFVRVSFAVRVLAVLVAIAVLPYTLQTWDSARGAQAQAQRWAAAANTVSVTFTSELESAAAQVALNDFAARVDKLNIAALSFTLDESVRYSPAEMSGFDHIILTDRSFLDLMLAPLAGADYMSAFARIDPSQLPAALWSSLAPQMSILAADRKADSPHLAYYTYASKTPLPAIGNTLAEGRPVNAHNPLVVLIDRPLVSMSLTGFLISAMINGNLIFTDEDAVRGLLQELKLTSVVGSVDNVAAATLTAAQSFAQLAWMGLVATCLIILAIAFAVIQAAGVWASVNAKRIFALRTYGRSYWRILSGQAAHEGAFIAASGALAVWASTLVFTMPVQEGVAIALVIMPVYVASSLLAHRASAHLSFARSLERKAQ